VTPEKKKYPVPANRLNARLVNRKKRNRTDAPVALRSAIQNTKAATRFASVPPAATSRESKSLDHATVVHARFCAGEQSRRSMTQSLVQDIGNDLSQEANRADC
jgi:hypothetical protein